MTLKTVDDMMQMIDSYYLLQENGLVLTSIRAELEKWRKEIDRLTKSLKLQQEVSDNKSNIKAM